MPVILAIEKTDFETLFPNRIFGKNMAIVITKKNRQNC